MLFYRGANVLYKLIVEPIFKRYEKNLDQLIADLPGTVQHAIQSSGKEEFFKKAAEVVNFIILF
jgi:hypothetical protein